MRCGALHEPGIAQTLSVGQGIAVAVYDDILGVEHGQDRIVLQAFLQIGDCGGRGDDGIDIRSQTAHLRSDMEIYQILIPLELGRTVSAYSLVVVADDSVVEGIDTQVQDTVRDVAVLMYGVVHRTGIELGVEIAHGDKMLLVQIPLVHSPQVREKQDSYNCHGRQSLQLPLPCGEEHTCRKDNEYQRAEGIGPQKTAAVVLESTDEQVIGPEYGCIARRGEVTGQTRKEGEEQGYAAGNPEGGQQAVLYLLLRQGFLAEKGGIETENAHQRDGHLEDDQNHGDGAELIVQRSILEEQLGEPHEMRAPGQQQCEDRNSRYPPL